ncbi:MAG: MBL fold metallo-hydrolase [Janthinobacterium lividum]
MANVVQLTPRLWQLKLNLVNCYLLETEDGLLLIDTGYPNSTDKLFAAVRESGHDPAAIRHLLLTHCHIDHGGSAAEVRRRTGARTYAHALDAPLIAKGIAERPGTTRTPGLVNWLVYLFFIKYAGTTYEPLPVDQVLEHGQVLPWAGGVEVIHSPGHSAGHICLLLRQEGLLIAADLCSHVMGLKYSTINEDRALAQQSLLRVAEYPFERAVFGHGDALQERANQQLKETFAAS